MQNPPLILIVDDEPSYLEIFSLKLKSMGYATDTASDARQGIEKIKALHPDLVLMDVQMPEMTGIEALITIKDDPACKDLKVLFLTNLGDTMKEAQGVDDRFSKELGAVGYLKKSSDLDELMEKVISHLK